MTRRWTPVLTAGLVAAVLAGCSEAEDAERELPGSTSAPATSSSAAPTVEALPPLGPADLPMPAEARTQDAAGAEAFVRYYLELINRTSTVMDAAPLREFSDGCRDCDRIADNTEQDASDGYRYQRGVIVIKAAGAANVSGEEARIAFTLDQAPLEVVDGNGTRIPDLSSGALLDLSGGARATWDDTRQTWLMSTLTLG